MELESTFDFSFGFGDPNYSDRILLLESVDDAADSELHDDLLINAKTAPRVKAIHITSLILAARSPFFRKLFSNGMQESHEKNITIRIKASEEVSFMDLLNYIYSNNVPTTLNALLDLLVMSDKYEVASCLRDCIRSLQTLPMTSESASLYLDLPQCLLMSPTVQPLIDAAKQFLVSHYKDFQRYKEMLNLPLACIQVVLFSDELSVVSECVVYNFVLAWVNMHYPDMDERREMLERHLIHLVRFPFMTTKELKEEVQTCKDIDPEVASKIVNRALAFKAETSHWKHCLAAKEDSAASRQFVLRDYLLRPVKVVELEVPYQCIVYLELTREEIRCVNPVDGIMSQIFHLGSRQLFLTALSSLVRRTNRHYFFVSLEMLGSEPNTIKYETAVRKKPREDFECLARGSHNFTKQSNIDNLLSVKWTGFIEDDSPYFINDVLHMRINLTIKK